MNNIIYNINKAKVIKFVLISLAQVILRQATTTKITERYFPVGLGQTKVPVKIVNKKNNGT